MKNRKKARQKKTQKSRMLINAIQMLQMQAMLDAESTAAKKKLLVQVMHSSSSKFFKLGLVVRINRNCLSEGILLLLSWAERSLLSGIIIVLLPRSAWSSISWLLESTIEAPLDGFSLLLQTLGGSQWSGLRDLWAWSSWAVHSDAFAAEWKWSRWDFLGSFRYQVFSENGSLVLSKRLKLLDWVLHEMLGS